MTTPSGPKKPKKPRPKYVEFDNNTFAFLDESEGLEVGSILYAYTGEENEYGSYDELETGTYYMGEGEPTITVGENGEITGIS